MATYEMDAARPIAAGNRVNVALAALMSRRCQHSCTFGRTQCSVGTGAVLRQQNVGIAEDECCGDAIYS